MKKLSARDVAVQLAAVQDRADRVAAGLTPGQFNWQPDAGRAWSVGQCLDHLVRANEIYLVAVNAAIAAAPARTDHAFESAKPNLLGGWFASLMEPPVTRRVGAPERAQPSSTLDPDDTRSRFASSLSRIQDCADAAWQIDLNRTRFRNPFLRGVRVFNVAAAFAILLSHCRRHLWQAEQVIARSEFPGGPSARS